MEMIKRESWVSFLVGKNHVIALTSSEDFNDTKRLRKLIDAIICPDALVLMSKMRVLSFIYYGLYYHGSRNLLMTVENFFLRSLHKEKPKQRS